VRPKKRRRNKKKKTTMTAAAAAAAAAAAVADEPSGVGQERDARFAELSLRLAVRKHLESAGFNAAE